jgi:hypothetical protein
MDVDDLIASAEVPERQQDRRHDEEQHILVEIANPSAPPHPQRHTDDPDAVDGLLSWLFLALKAYDIDLVTGLAEYINFPSDARILREVRVDHMTSSHFPAAT